MVVARSSAEQQRQSPEGVERSAAILRLFGTLCSIPSVRRIGMLASSPLLDLWVQLAGDREEDELRIYSALDELDAQRLGPTVDVHVVLASDPESAFPGETTVVFERP